MNIATFGYHVPVEHLEIIALHKILGDGRQPQKHQETFIVLLLVQDLVDQRLKFLPVIKVQAQFVGQVLPSFNIDND